MSDPIWMRCRAKSDQQIDSKSVCPGNYAVIVLQKELPLIQGGGKSTRYRCTTCKGSWFIRL